MNQSESSESVLRRAAWRQLHARFRAGFDRSQAEAWLGRIAKGLLPIGVSLIGGGAHCQAYLCRRGEAAAAPLVIKWAVGGRARADDVHGRKWRQALQTLRQVPAGQVAMMPPFEVIEAEGAFGLVMPYADRPWQAAAALWTPLSARLAEMATDLALLGLELDDVEQGGLCEGIPIVYDLSDLRPR